MTKIKIVLLCETRVARAIKLKEGNIWKLMENSLLSGMWKYLCSTWSISKIQISVKLGNI